jgi:MFS family permease
MAATTPASATPSLGSVLLAVAPLLFSAAIMIMGNGLFGTLLAVRMDLDGFDVGTIGFVLAFYAGGFALGTLICPRIVLLVGHIRTFAAFAAIASAAALFHALWVDPIVWAALRLVTGISMAVLFTIIESWLNARAVNAVRGRVMSSYMAVNYTAFGLSQPWLTMMDPASFALFSVVAMLISLSLVPLALTPVETPPVIKVKRFGLRTLIAISPLGVAGCVSVGLISAAFSGMGPVYARTIDPSPNWIASFMMTAIFAGFLLQYPVGRLSDRFDRRQVFLGITISLALISAALALFGGTSMTLLLVLLAAFGGLSYTIYPLSLSHANDFMTPEQLVPAAAGLLLCYGSGAIFGPIVASQVMQLLGPDGLFVWTGSVAALLALFTIYRMTRRAAKPNEEQGSFVSVAPTTTPVAAELDPRGPDETPSTMRDAA